MLQGHNRRLLVFFLLTSSCAPEEPAAPPDGSAPIGEMPDAAAGGDLSDADAAVANDAAAPPCTTRITYGQTWIHGAQHPDPFDIATGLVTWDGVCTDDGANSYALLSNGWKPYFAGHGTCIIALDDNCSAPPAACATRVSYGPAWQPAAGHPAHYDDVAGRLTWDGVCRPTGSDSYARLSNGWTPTFTGADACELSFTYAHCGGLYANPVVAEDCADPGVLRDGNQYVMTCTSGGAADAFPIRVSPDLVRWTRMGAVFPSGKHPAWATGDFWAPEIHRVGAHYVAYFTARNVDGRLSIGAASAPTALGPFTDRGAPLLHDAAMGLIDASEFEAPDGTRYLLWKDDGNAVGKPTPIHAQALAPDGLSIVGTATTLITNDQSWEGAVVEGPWMLYHEGAYYLFYSGNAYNTAAYAVGVARAASPLGPFTKATVPILTTAGAWAGPGHGSVLDTPDGETVFVYHAWRSGQVGGAPGRLGLVDRVVWSAGWPSLPGAPSSSSLPLP
jgi:arabinan endo-1,5-alpha-L-arabinosidase